MGSSGGGGGGSGDSTNTVRYAPYIEEHHKTFLDLSADSVSMALLNNPYTGYSDFDFDDAFYGAGFTLASFPSLYDMYGKFMAGLDIEALWIQIFNSTQDNSAISALVTAEANLLDEQLEQIVLPRFQAGQRDMNAVLSSSFVIGKSLLETSRDHDIAKFDAELRYKLIPIAYQRWSTHLEWNKSIIAQYVQLLQFVLNTKLVEDDRNYDIAVKDTLWPFTVLDYARANIAGLQGAISGKQSVAGASQGQRAIGGAMSGAAAGAAIGGPVGAGIGGFLGLAASFF